MDDFARDGSSDAAMDNDSDSFLERSVASWSSDDSLLDSSSDDEFFEEEMTAVLATVTAAAQSHQFLLPTNWRVIFSSR